MIYEIIHNIQNLLKENKFDIESWKDPANSPPLKTPSVNVSIENADFVFSAMNKLKTKIEIKILVCVENIKDKSERVKVVSSIINFIIQLMFDNNLGLQIEPLIPINLKEITPQDYEKAGFLIFQITLKTSYEIQKMNDEEITELKKIYADYYIGDQKKAEDIINVE